MKYVSSVKVLALFNGEYPGGMAMSNRLHYYAKAVNNGPWKMHVASAQSTVSFGSFEGISFFCMNCRAVLNAMQRRVNHYFLNGLKTILFFNGKKHDYEVFWLIGFSFWTTLVISTIAGIHGKKIVVEVNEKPYTVGGSTFSEFKLWNRFWRSMTYWFLYPRIHGFVVISEALERLVSTHKSAGAKVIRIPVLNHVRSDERDANSESAIPFLLHAGALSEKKDGILTVLAAFAEAARRIAPRRVTFLLTSKVALPSLQRRIDAMTLAGGLQDRIIFTGHLSAEELERYMRNAACAIVHKPDNEQNRFNFPTKLGDYLSYGIPVIASRGGEMGRYLVDGKNCFLIDAGDVAAIAEKIVYILDHPQMARRVGLEGRRTVEDHFCYSRYSHKLESFFQSVISS